MRRSAQYENTWPCTRRQSRELDFHIWNNFDHKVRLFERSAMPRFEERVRAVLARVQDLFDKL
jgi:hypothetical protein